MQHRFRLNVLKGGLTQLCVFFVSLCNDMDETLEFGIKLFSLPEALYVSSVLCNNCLMSQRAACAHKHLFAESFSSATTLNPFYVWRDVTVNCNSTSV